MAAFSVMEAHLERERLRAEADKAWFDATENLAEDIPGDLQDWAQSQCWYRQDELDGYWALPKLLENIVSASAKGHPWILKFWRGTDSCSGIEDFEQLEELFAQLGEAWAKHVRIKTERTTDTEIIVMFYLVGAEYPTYEDDE